jgi:2'-5' RNA ligase superfamily
VPDETPEADWPRSADTGIYRAPADGLARLHATAFLDARHSGPVERLRTYWDPAMSRQIAAHVTLIYPEEVPAGADLEQLAVAGAGATAAFTIALGPVFYVSSPANGVFFRVRDLDGGISKFRTAAVPPSHMIDFPPHVTIVHPSTSDRGRQAWDELADTHIDGRFTITYVAITASKCGRWQTMRRHRLTGDRKTPARERRAR